MAKHVIIGAGPLACMQAVKLARAGHEVTIYERGERLCPNLATGRLHGSGAKRKRGADGSELDGPEERHRPETGRAEALQFALRQYKAELEAIKPGAYLETSERKASGKHTKYLRGKGCPAQTTKQLEVPERFINDKFRVLFEGEFKRLGVKVNFRVTAQKNKQDELILREKRTNKEITDWINLGDHLSICIGASGPELYPEEIGSTQMARMKRASILTPAEPKPVPSYFLNAIDPKGGASISPCIEGKHDVFVSNEAFHDPKVSPSTVLTRLMAALLTLEAKDEHLKSKLDSDKVDPRALRIYSDAVRKLQDAGGNPQIGPLSNARLVEFAAAVQRNNPLDTTQTGLVKTVEVKLPGGYTFKAVVGASRKITTSVQAANDMMNEHERNDLLRVRAAAARQQPDLKRGLCATALLATPKKRAKPDVPPRTPTRSPSPVTPESAHGNMPNLLLGGIDPGVRALASPHHDGTPLNTRSVSPRQLRMLQPTTMQ
jgi:hypothetical protein